MHRIFIDHLNEMAGQQLRADSLGAWPREDACIDSTLAADAMLRLSSGHKNFVGRRPLE